MINLMQTVKKCIFQDQSVLRMTLSIEGIWYIWLESSNSTIQKELLWNGDSLVEGNRAFEEFKFNPLINGGDETYRN